MLWFLFGAMVGGFGGILWLVEYREGPRAERRRWLSKELDTLYREFAIRAAGTEDGNVTPHDHVHYAKEALALLGSAGRNLLMVSERSIHAAFVEPPDACEAVLEDYALALERVGAAIELMISDNEFQALGGYGPLKVSCQSETREKRRVRCEAASQHMEQLVETMRRRDKIRWEA